MCVCVCGCALNVHDDRVYHVTQYVPVSGKITLQVPSGSIYTGPVPDIDGVGYAVYKVTEAPTLTKDYDFIQGREEMQAEARLHGLPFGLQIAVITSGYPFVVCYYDGTQYTWRYYEEIK